MGCLALLQGVFATQGSNPGLLHLQADSLPFEPAREAQIYIYIYTMEYYSTKKRNKNGSFAAVVAMWMNLDSANKADFH